MQANSPDAPAYQFTVEQGGIINLNSPSANAESSAATQNFVINLGKEGKLIGWGLLLLSVANVCIGVARLLGAGPGM